MEEELFAEQIKRIQSYIPFLEQIIKRFQEKANSKNQQLLLKILKIYKIVTNAEDNRPSVETLDKCEQLLRGFKIKLNNFEEKLTPRIQVDNGAKISDTESDKSIPKKHNTNEKAAKKDEVNIIQDKTKEANQTERQIPIQETTINTGSNVETKNKSNIITTDEVIDVEDYDKAHSSKTECLGLTNFTENRKTAKDKEKLIIQNSCNVITKEDLSGILADVLNSNIASKLVEAIFSKANAKINTRVKQENIKPEIITLSDDEDIVKIETNIEVENHTRERVNSNNTTQENVELSRNLQLEATVAIPQEVLEQFVPDTEQMSDNNEVLVNGTPNIMNSDHGLTSTSTKDIGNERPNEEIPIQRCDSLRSLTSGSSHIVKPSPVQIASQEQSLDTARSNENQTQCNKSLKKTTSRQETSNETAANDHQLDMNSKGNLGVLNSNPNVALTNSLENIAALRKVEPAQSNVSENVKKTKSDQNSTKTNQTHIINLDNLERTKKITTRNLTTLVTPKVNNANGSGSVAVIKTNESLLKTNQTSTSTPKSDQANVDSRKVSQNIRTRRKTEEISLNTNKGKIVSKDFDGNLKKAKKRKIDETEAQTDQSIIDNLALVQTTNKRKSDQNDMENHHFADSVKKTRNEVKEISPEKIQPQNSLSKNSLIEVNPDAQINVGAPSKRNIINRMSKEETQNFRWDIKSTTPMPNMFNVKVKLKNFCFDKFMDGHVHWVIEDEQTMEKEIPKNNDITMYYKSDCDKCIICLKRERLLPIHYLKSHPEHEVFISRLSPVVSEKLRNNENNLPENYQNLYKMQCQFCKRFVIGSSYVWLSHYSYHTAEHCFQCSVCENQGLNHSKCKRCNRTKTQPITGLNAKTLNIEAFMCDLCNYIQLTELSLQKHVKDQHETMETYRKVTLLDVNRTKSKISLNCLPRQYPPKKNSVVENPNEVENLEQNQELDLPTAHLPSKALEILKKDRGNKSIKQTDTTFRHKCPFCEEILCLSPQAWMGHFLKHTGESRIQCRICMRSGVEWADFSDFKDCPHMSSETFKFYRNSDVIQMYVCELCNFTQIFKRNIERHVIIKHFLDANKISGNIVSVNLLKFEGYKRQTIVETKQNEIKRKRVAGSKTDLPETVLQLQDESVEEESNSSSTQRIGKLQNSNFHTTPIVTQLKLPTTSGHCTSKGLAKSSTNDQNTEKDNDVASLGTDDNKNKDAKTVNSNNDTVGGSKTDLPETTSGHCTSQGLPKGSTNDQNTKKDNDVTSLDTDGNKNKDAKTVNSNNNTVGGSKSDLPETTSGHRTSQGLLKTSTNDKNTKKDNDFTSLDTDGNKNKDAKTVNSNNNTVGGSKTDLPETVLQLPDESVEAESNSSSTHTIGNFQNTNCHTTPTATQVKLPTTSGHSTSKGLPKSSIKDLKDQNTKNDKCNDGISLDTDDNKNKDAKTVNNAVGGSKPYLPETVLQLEDAAVDSSTQTIGKSQNTNFHTTPSVTQLKLPTTSGRTSQGLPKTSTNNQNDMGNAVILLDTDDNKNKDAKEVSSNNNTVGGSKTDLPETVLLLENESMGEASNSSSTQTIGKSQNTNFHTTPTVTQLKLPTTSGHRTYQGLSKSNDQNDMGNDVICLDTDDNKNEDANTVSSNNDTVGGSKTDLPETVLLLEDEASNSSSNQTIGKSQNTNFRTTPTVTQLKLPTTSGRTSQGLPKTSTNDQNDMGNDVICLDTDDNKSKDANTDICNNDTVDLLSLRKVNHFGFSITGDKKFMYYCLYERCSFSDRHPYTVREHMSTTHRHIKWDSYCYICKGFTLPNRNYKIHAEYIHMLCHLSPMDKKIDHRQYPAASIKYKINNGPCTIDRITNIGFAVNEQQQIVYYCLVNSCMYHSTNSSYVYAHFSGMHPNTQWDQYCEMCNRFLRFKFWSHFSTEWEHLFQKHVIRKSRVIKDLSLAESSKANSTNNNTSEITSRLNTNSTVGNSICEKPTISERPEITNPLNANSTNKNSICEKPAIIEKPPVTRPQIKIRRLSGDSLSKPTSTASKQHTAISNSSAICKPAFQSVYCQPISVPIVCQPISATADCEPTSSSVNLNPVTESRPTLNKEDENITSFRKNRQISIIKHKRNHDEQVRLRKLLENRSKLTSNIKNSTTVLGNTAKYQQQKYQQHCVYNGGSTIVLKKVFEPHLIENHVVVDPLTIPNSTNSSSVQNEPNKNVVSSGNIRISSIASTIPAMNKISLHTELNKSKLKPWVKFTSHKPDDVAKKQLNDICLYSLYKCMNSTCSFSTCTAESMLKHLEEHEKTSSVKVSKFECPYCPLIARTGKLLVDHITVKHTLDIYQCPYCFYRSCDQTNVLNHLNMYHISEKKCILMCHGETKIVDLNFITEMVKAHVKPLICSKCSLNFFIISSFIDHMITTHGQKNSNEAIACGMCHKVRLSNEHTMMRHLTNVHKIARFECIYCDFLTNESTEIGPHIAHSHCSEISWICERKQNLGANIPPVGEQTVFNATILRRFTYEKSLKIIQKCPYTIEQLNFWSNSIPNKTKSLAELIVVPEKQTESNDTPRLLENVKEIIVHTVNTPPRNTSDKIAKPQSSTIIPNQFLKTIKLPKGFSLQIVPKPQT